MKDRYYYNSVSFTRQQKMVILGILKQRLEELKKCDTSIPEMYMFDITINDIIKKLETPYIKK